MAFACVRPNLHQTAREMAMQTASTPSLARSISLNRAANVEERTRIQTRKVLIQGEGGGATDGVDRTDEIWNVKHEAEVKM